MSVLKQIREQKGYTQNDLAKKTGLSLRTIQRLESTNKVPKGYTLNTLAAEFDIKPSTLQDKYIHDKLTHESAISKLNLINLSILSFLFLPFGNLILPFYIFKKNEQLQLVNEIGKRILNFQIIFTIILCMVLIILPFTLVRVLPDIPVMMIFLILAYLFNIIIVFKTSLKIKQKNFDFLDISLRFI